MTRLVLMGWTENDGPEGLRAPEFPYRFNPTCMVCPLAPSPDELFITAADVRTTQRWLISISVRASLHINSDIARLVSRWRVGTNAKITSNTYDSSQYFCILVYGRTG